MHGDAQASGRGFDAGAVLEASAELQKPDQRGARHHRQLGASARSDVFRTADTTRRHMLVLVAGPLVAGHPCVQSDLRSRSSEPAGTQYLRGPTATYATADVRSLPAHMATPFAHAEASPPRRAGGGRSS